MVLVAAMVYGLLLVLLSWLEDLICLLSSMIFLPFVLLDAGNDKKPGAGSVNGFKIIPRSPCPCAMGSNKCNWAIVHGLGPRVASSLPRSSAACISWSYG